jgi:hypothetical protein
LTDRLLRATSPCCRPPEPQLVMLHRWLVPWRGLGDIVAGMRRGGFKLGLEDFGERWVAVSYQGSGGAAGLGTAGVAQEAVQRAAWGAVEEGAELIRRSGRRAAGIRDNRVCATDAGLENPRTELIHSR